MEAGIETLVAETIFEIPSFFLLGTHTRINYGKKPLPSDWRHRLRSILSREIARGKCGVDVVVCVPTQERGNEGNLFPFVVLP